MPKRTKRATPASLAAKAATREALVLAATLEMARHGIDNASLDAICARAGLTRGAFYVHFRNRDQLIAAAVDRVISHNQAALLGDGAEHDLRRIILRFLARIAAGDPTAVGTVSWRFRHTLAACARVPAVRARYLELQAKGVARIAEAVRAGQADGSVRDDVASRAVAELLVTLSLGISAAIDLGMPLELAAGAAALEKLLTRPSASVGTRPRPRAPRR